MSAHLQSTYGAEVESEAGHSGVFDVTVDGELIFSKHKVGRFPTLSEIDELIAGP